MAKLIEITGKALSGEWGLEDKSKTGIPVLRTTNFTNFGIINYGDVITRNITKKNISEKFLRKGDIIIEKSGGSDKQPVGRVVLFNGEENRFLFNNFTGVLRVKDHEKWVPDYVFYALFANYRNGGTRKYENKTTGLHNLKTDLYINKYEIEWVNITEQKNVCATLRKIESIISDMNKEITYLDNLIKARFVEMFGTSGANPKGWNEIKLGEVCSLQNGYAFKSSDYINKSSVLNCRMSNIRPDGGFDAEYHPKYLPDEYWDKCSGYRLFDGDVIIAMTDMASDPKILGVPTIVSTNGKKFLLNQRVGKLSFLHDDRMNRVYLMHSLGQKYIRKELAKSAAGSTQINVGKPAILNINIYDPPRSLQDQFATFVVQVDKSKFALSNELAMGNFYIRLIHDCIMHGCIDL